MTPLASHSADLDAIRANLETQVLIYLQSRKDQGASCSDVERALQLPHQTASARIHNLMAKRLIVDSQQVAISDHGRASTVWVAREFAAPEVLEHPKAPRETKADLRTCLSGVICAAVPVLELLKRIEETGPLEGAKVAVQVTHGSNTRMIHLDPLELIKLRDQLAQKAP